MYLMYVDESGDPGLNTKESSYFVLTGLVVHELRWSTYLNQLINFRQQMRQQFGLKLREEIHAAKMVGRSGSLSRIPKHQRLEILRLFADQLATMSDLNLISVAVDKQGKGLGYDVFENAWSKLLQRLENTISYHNFRGPQNSGERGMVFADNTDGKKLTQILRRMRRYNPIPNQVNMDLVIEICYSTMWLKIPIFVTHRIHTLSRRQI